MSRGSKLFCLAASVGGAGLQVDGRCYQVGDEVFRVETLGIDQLWIDWWEMVGATQLRSTCSELPGRGSTSGTTRMASEFSHGLVTQLDPLTKRAVAAAVLIAVVVVLAEC